MKTSSPTRVNPGPTHPAPTDPLHRPLPISQPFGGGGTHNGKSQAYGGGANQAAFDMAYMLDGKYQLKKDPTLRGHVRSPYL